MDKEKSLVGKATHEEICDSALRDYLRISRDVCEWSSTIEKAIKFYRQFGDKNFKINDYPKKNTASPKRSEMVSECCGAEITRVKKWPKTGWPQLDWERNTKWKFKCSECHNPTKPVEAKEKTNE